MMRQVKDNYRETHQALAARILRDPLAQHVGYTGRSEQLQRDAAGEGDLSRWSFQSVEFRRADTNCSLDVRVESVDRGYRLGPDTDKEGNEWTQYELSCSVNFPCHGSSDPATVMARLKLYQDVAMLAAELQAEFGGRREIWKMTRTAAEVAEAKAKAEAEKLSRKAREIVQAARKGMRKGGDAVVAYNNVEGIPAGKYPVQIDEPTGNVLPDGSREMKQFELEVFANLSSGVAGIVRRVA